MTDVAALGLAVDSSAVETATGRLRDLNQEAAKSPDRVGRLSQASDVLVQALQRNTQATEALSTRMAAMETAADRAAGAFTKVGTGAQAASGSVVQFTGASQQAQQQLDLQAQAANRAAQGWGNLGTQAAEALRKITAARAAVASAPPPMPPPIGTPAQAPGIDPLFARLGPAGANQNYQLTPQGLAEMRLRSLSSDGNIGGAGPGMPRNMNGRMSANQLQNLFYQGSDVAVTAAMGMNPLMIGLQQGPQIAQSFMGPGSGTIGGLASQTGEALAGLAARIGVFGGAIAGVTAAVATAIVAQQSYSNQQTEIARQLRSTGRTSGATLADINAVAAAGGGGLSTRARRGYAGQLAATGAIGPGMYDPILGTLRDYAATTGQEQPEALEQLAAAFANPAKGAETLNKQLGFLNGTQAENIRRLQAQGDMLGAQQTLLAAYSGSLAKASDSLSGWAKVSEMVLVPIANLWDKLGQAIDKATTGGSLDDRIAALQNVLKDAPESPGGLLGFLGVGAQRGALEAELRQLTEQRNRELGNADRAQQNARSRALKENLDALNPATKAIEDLEDRAKAIRRPFTENWIDPFGAAKQAIDAIGVQVGQMRKDLEAGGASFADSLRSSQNQLRTASFAPEAQSVASIREQAESQRISAMRAAATNPNLDEGRTAYEAQLRTINEQEQNLLRAQQIRTESSGGRYGTSIRDVPEQYRDTVYNAATQAGISPDLLASVFRRESRFRPDVISGATRSPAGAIGPFQFMPDTARGYGVDPLDFNSSANGAARMLAERIRARRGDEALAVADYDWGLGNVNRVGGDISRFPGETRGYINEVFGPRANAQSQVQEMEQRRRQLELEADQYRAAAAAGGENTAQLRVQQEVLKGLSDAQGQNIQVSQSYTEQLQTEARARENLRLGNQYLSFTANDNFARDQLGRTREEQGAYAAARPYAGSDYYNGVLGRSLETAQMAETKGLVMDASSSFVQALRRGASATEAFASVAGNVADKMLNKVLDSVISAGFSGASGGGFAGMLSSLGGLFGGGGGGGSPTGGVRLFADGGWTGPGGKHDPAGIVHRGEVVWSQSDVARFGGAAVVERMRLGMPGYADGGVVGAANGNTPVTAPRISFISQPGFAIEEDGPPRQRADGGLDQFVRVVENKIGARGMSGRGTFRQLGGPAYNQG